MEGDELEGGGTVAASAPSDALSCASASQTAQLGRGVVTDLFLKATVPEEAHKLYRTLWVYVHPQNSTHWSDRVPIPSRLETHQNVTIFDNWSEPIHLIPQMDGNRFCELSVGSFPRLGPVRVRIATLGTEKS